jgi:hypothetical protein
VKNDELKQEFKSLSENYNFTIEKVKKFKNPVLALRANGKYLFILFSDLLKQSFMIKLFTIPDLIPVKQLHLPAMPGIFINLEGSKEIIFNYFDVHTRSSDQDLQSINIDSGKITKFSRDNLNKRWLIDAKPYADGVMISDCIGHALLHYDSLGNLVEKIDLSGFCEFPRFFSPDYLKKEVYLNLPNSDSKENNLGGIFFDKYSSVDINRTNIRLIDLKRKQIIRETEIRSRNHWFSSITVDERGFLYLMESDYLYKVDRELNLFYSLNLHEKIHGYLDNSLFISGVCNKRKYYFLERKSNSLYVADIGK